ncbi:hypothetical protein BD410DRAFT_551154 [Rickenella mellea]|uniref:Uncharacterized protein n=1 Tax=Rickenella mellea TaxID=50990 RepID=A0A4Y7PRD1_9AGAM|nr:hypothetical protein BD410DRAFT_551154 [Rickenella mellea]
MGHCWFFSVPWYAFVSFNDNRQRGIIQFRRSRIWSRMSRGGDTRYQDGLMRRTCPHYHRDIKREWSLLLVSMYIVATKRACPDTSDGWLVRRSNCARTRMPSKFFDLDLVRHG